MTRKVLLNPIESLLCSQFFSRFFNFFFSFFQRFHRKKLASFGFGNFLLFEKAALNITLRLFFCSDFSVFLKKYIKAKVFAHQRNFFWPISESLCL